MKKFFQILFLLIAIGGVYFSYQVLLAPNNFEGDRVVKISKGESFEKVVDKLVKTGIVRNKRYFKLAARLYSDAAKKIQIGKYRFKSGKSNVGILEDLGLGKSVESIIVTIPEGYTIKRQAGLFARLLGIDSSLYAGLAYEENFTNALGINAPNLEGYLMPNSYKFSWQENEDVIIKTLVEQFREKITQEDEARAEEMNLTWNEVLTMASIVEGETKIEAERPIVAGVYYNRLKKNMLLQADPTIQYIIEKGPRVLRYSDLTIASPYNTYLHKGLPPGPVNNPGVAAIHAALYPRKHTFLFFVANGLGGHTFSKNYIEHKKAVRNFRKTREEQRIAREQNLQGK